jgi:hypothetical protein
MPHADHRFSLQRPAVALLAASLLAASPASAQPARSQLSVGARVLPSCEVATESDAAEASCTDGSGMSVSVERREAASFPDRPAIGRAAKAGEPASTPTWVTVTY